MVSNMTVVDIGYLGLEEWMPPLGTYPFTYEVGMGMECMTLRL